MNPPDIEQNLKLVKSRNPINQQVGIHYLVCKFQPLIHRLSYQICPTCNINDMVGAGNLGIMRAIRTYNNTSSFNTWVYTQIRNELQKQREIEFPVKISRFLLKKGNKATFHPLEGNEIYNSDPKDSLIIKEDAERITEALRHINLMFPKRHCKIFCDYYFLNIPLIKLSKQYKLNANAIVRAMILAIRSSCYNNSEVK